MARLIKTASLAVAAGAMVLGGAGAATADAGAQGAAVGSPGVLSGNVVQVPINIPVNVCGNSVSVIGLLNPAAGNYCQNGDNGGGKDYDRGYDKDRHHDDWDKGRDHHDDWH